MKIYLPLDLFLAYITALANLYEKIKNIFKKFYKRGIYSLFTNEIFVVFINLLILVQIEWAYRALNS